MIATPDITEVLLSLLAISGADPQRPYLAGELIAQWCYQNGFDQEKVSRNAINKRIKLLVDAGYEIEAVKNKGYRLAPGQTVMTKSLLALLLTEVGLGEKEIKRIETRRKIGSTNALARELADEDDEASPGLVVADEQSQGAGRQQKTFYSPLGGLYLSLYFKPKASTNELPLMTLAAAVAAAQACDQLLGTHCSVKWVNDLYWQDKKVGGILTEAAFSIEDGAIKWAVVGIGLNLLDPSQKMKELAGEKGDYLIGGLQETVTDPLLRVRLTVAIVRRFLDYAINLSQRTYLEDYRRRLLYVGEPIFALAPSTSGEKDKTLYRCLGIDDNGRLIVEDETGVEKRLLSGEISVRQEQRKMSGNKIDAVNQSKKSATAFKKTTEINWAEAMTKSKQREKPQVIEALRPLYQMVQNKIGMEGEIS